MCGITGQGSPGQVGEGRARDQGKAEPGLHTAAWGDGEAGRCAYVCVHVEVGRRNGKSDKMTSMSSATLAIYAEELVIVLYCTPSTRRALRCTEGTVDLHVLVPRR